MVKVDEISVELGQAGIGGSWPLDHVKQRPSKGISIIPS